MKPFEAIRRHPRVVAAATVALLLAQVRWIIDLVAKPDASAKMSSTGKASLE